MCLHKVLCGGSVHTQNLIPYRGKLSREKTFTNFAVLWLFAKVFSVKFWGIVSFGAAKVSNPQKFSPRKSYFLLICKSFLPRKFSAIGSSRCMIQTFMIIQSMRQYIQVFVSPHWLASELKMNEPLTSLDSDIEILARWKKKRKLRKQGWYQYQVDTLSYQVQYELVLRRFSHQTSGYFCHQKQS